MARKRTVAKPKEKAIDHKDRICAKCINAYLMQSAKCNPVVAECTLTKERHVSVTPHMKDCGFKENKGEVIIHEMIYVK